MDAEYSSSVKGGAGPRNHRQYRPRLARDGVFLIASLAERDDLREVAVELDGERVIRRRQLDAVDQRANDLAGLSLGLRLAESLFQLGDLATVERRQIGVNAELRQF